MYEKVSRFAPSPSGKLHIGGAMSALYTFLMVKGMGGNMKMRIDDTDTFRSSSYHERKITDSLKWLGMTWDNDSVVRQSERLPMYKEAAESLILTGAAYPCFCDKTQLSLNTERFGRKGTPFVYDGNCRNIPAHKAFERMFSEKYTIRLKNTGMELNFKDTILGKKSFKGDQFGDFIIMRDDGWPTYNFACVADDIMMDITHVTRGSDHIINTPKQLLIYDALGCTPPKFTHFPLVMDDKTNKKMSKRDGTSMSICEYRSIGVSPKAMAVHLVKMGLKIKNLDNYSMPNLIRKFDVSRIKKAQVFHSHDDLMSLDKSLKNITH